MGKMHARIALAAVASAAAALVFGGVPSVGAMSNVQMGEVRYLAADGDDARDGKTPETAWRTLSRLNDGLPSGYRIHDNTVSKH